MLANWMVLAVPAVSFVLLAISLRLKNRGAYRLGSESSIEVTERVCLAPGCAISLLTVDGKRILLATSGNAIGFHQIGSTASAPEVRL